MITKWSEWFRRREIQRLNEVLRQAEARRDHAGNLDETVEALACRMEDAPVDLFAAEVGRALRGG